MLLARTALRSLRHTPSFTATTVLVLGLGLGANVVLFNALHALLWRPLPFPDPGRLMSLKTMPVRGEGHTLASGRNAVDLKERVPTLGAVGLIRGTGAVTLVLGSDETLDLPSAAVNADYLTALGLKPVAGRFFGPDDDFGRTGEERALLAESVWRHHFGGDPAMAGGLLNLLDGADRRAVRVVGVYPDRVTLPYAAGTGVLTAIPWRTEQVAANRGNLLYRTLLRVKPGVDVTVASAQAKAALRLSEQEVPERQRGSRFELVSIRSAVLPSETPAWFLYAAAGLLFLLTTINVASLFLTRALGRRHEAAVRMALGASFRRTLSEQLAEALWVCAGGLAVGLLLNEYARTLVPEFLPQLRELGPELLESSWVPMAFGGVLAFVAACGVVILPLRQSRRVGLVASLAEGTRASGTRTAWRAVLASAQLSVILVLLSLGGLAGRSLVAALRTDPGFDASNVLTLRAAVPGAGDARLSAAADLAHVLASVPGTTSVGVSAERLLGATYSTTHSVHPGDFEASDPSIPFRMVDGGYFAALGLRLQSGRVPTEAEVVRGSDVAVLNESAARTLFGRTDAVGRRVHSGLGGSWLTVIGIVKDARTEGLDLPAPPTVYRPYYPLFGSDVMFTVRASRTADDYLRAARTRAKAWNAAVILRDARDVEELLRETVAGRMRASAVVGCFALLGLLVGTVGLYGTVAAYAQGLHRELGIRMALGASSRDVLLRVFYHGLRIVVPGALLGLGGSAGAAALVREQLYGIATWDLPAFTGALLVLTATSLAAALVPAVRASRESPAEALRQG